MTYEYVCEACGHLWEAEQSIKDSPLKKCVSCGKSKAKRLVSGGTGFLLKGGGWYADGYGSPGAGAAKAKSSDEKTGAKGSTKADGADSKSVDAKAGDAKAGSTSGAESKSGDSKAAADKGSSAPGPTAPPSGSAKAS
jgi:putative FmdB family regulatory protein